jgi:uncharacterized protein YaaR (DUF327 family)
MLLVHSAIKNKNLKIHILTTVGEIEGLNR